MKPLTITFVATISFVILFAEANAQEAVNLPAAVNADRQERNAAYKQRLLEKKSARRRKLQQRASTLAQQRAAARRERLASRVTARTNASKSLSAPDFDLNGERIESLSTTLQRQPDLAFLSSGYGYSVPYYGLGFETTGIFFAPTFR